MDPVYSRDECVAAIRDYYEFLAGMFMNPGYIIEPPSDGWPEINTESARGLGKTDTVIDLLRHLPYIANRPFSNHPQGLPGGIFIDWKNTIEQLKVGKAHPGNELLISEGEEERFIGKVPRYCIGLVDGGLLLGNGIPDVILLDTRSGVVYWMDCPPRIITTAAPSPSYLVYPLHGEMLGTNEESKLKHQSRDHDDEDKKWDENSEQVAGFEYDNENEDSDDNENEDSDDYEDPDLLWGECWPVRHFFEMLKNQFRQLNFIAKDGHEVFDVWTNETNRRTPIPPEFAAVIQTIYKKNGWPDMPTYNKTACQSEISQVLKERFHDHRRFYYRDLA